MAAPILQRSARRRRFAAFLLLVSFTCAFIGSMLMPGKSWTGPLPDLTPSQQTMRDQMRADLQHLSVTIGERNVRHYSKLIEAENFLRDSLTSAAFAVETQTYEVYGKKVANLIAELPGTSRREEIIIIGAHYDTVEGCPGANDNGSGCVGVLALARAFSGKPQDRTMRFALFVNEEPEFFQTDRMGSRVYAKECRKRDDRIVGMLSLETIGYYSEKKGSQQFPAPALGLIYPATGNFISFVGNPASDKLLKLSLKTFREKAQFPSEGITLPEMVPGAGWSDHWSFWQEGYPAVMLTDTAPFRYPHYHYPTDTIDKCDLDRMARVVDGVHAVLLDLSRAR